MRLASSNSRAIERRRASRGFASSRSCPIAFQLAESVAPRYIADTFRNGAHPTVWSIVQAAGWPIWPLIFASVIALALILERLWSLRQSVVAPPDLVDRVLDRVSAERRDAGVASRERRSTDRSAGYSPRASPTSRARGR